MCLQMCLSNGCVMARRSPGASGSSFQLLIDASLHGAQLVPVASSACGVTVGAARTIAVLATPEDGLIDWLSLRSRDATNYPASWCGYCTASSEAVTTYEYPNVGAGSGATRLQGTVGAPQSGGRGIETMTFFFRTAEPVRGVFSGVNAPGMYLCAPVPCATAGATLEGDVSTVFPTTVGAWGPIQVDMPPGQYSVRLYAGGGSICPGTGCTTCGEGSATILGEFTSLLPPCPGDQNGDGEVSAPDLIWLFNHWGRVGSLPEDIDRNGVVGTGDLSILLGNWGICR